MFTFLLVLTIVFLFAMVLDYTMCKGAFFMIKTKKELLTCATALAIPGFNIVIVGIVIGSFFSGTRDQ